LWLIDRVAAMTQECDTLFQSFSASGVAQQRPLKRTPGFAGRMQRRLRCKAS
jgi:hypothetical protein